MSPSPTSSDTPARTPFTLEPNAASGAVNAATRARILAYLVDHPTVSAVELSRAWGLTPADIRYHLSSLLEDGLLELAPRAPSLAPRRGRPTQVYRLAAQARPNNLPALCLVLLEMLLTPQDADAGQAAQQTIGASLADALSGGQSFHPNLTRRLSQVVETLNHAHYRARWEAAAQGPRILLRACPYATLLAQRPEICQVDQVLLERLLAVRLRHLTRQDPQTGQPPACIFTVQY